MMTESESTNAATEEAPAKEGYRRLDKAAGGDEVPLGPLGGPQQKSRERLLAEQELASGSEAEREAIDKAKEEVKSEAAAAEATKESEPLS